MISTSEPWFETSSPRYAATANPIQAAINDAVAANGGVVHIVRQFSFSSTTVIPYSPDDVANPLGMITLLGDAPQTCSIEKLATNPIDLLRVQRSNVTIRNLTFNGGGNILAGRGIVIGNPAASGDIRNVTVADCIVRGTGSHALHVIGGPGTPISKQNRFIRCDFAQNDHDSLVRIDPGNTDQSFEGCALHWYRNIALELRSCQGVRCYDCTFENPQDMDTALPYLLGDASHNCEFAGCWFEEQDTATVVKWFVDLVGCNAWTIYGCSFVRKIRSEPRALRIGSAVEGGQCRSILIANPRIVLFNNDTPDLFKHIELVNGNTECILVGGYLQTGSTTPVSTPLNLIDPTTKSMWLSNRRWRMPQVTPSENPNIGSLHLGDVLSRVGRGLEAWNALSGDSTWIPLSVNRYGTQTALDAVPTSSKNRGTMAWVDDEAAVKVWDGTAWKKLLLTS